VEFDKAMAPSVNGTDVTPAGGLGGATATANLDAINPSVVLITFNMAVADDDCYVFDLSGLKSADGGVFGSGCEDTTFCLCYLEGDVDMDGMVAGLDMAKIVSPPNWLMPVGVAADRTADVDRDGTVAGLDAARVAANWLNTPATPCP
jgi:hypothetical protein